MIGPSACSANASVCARGPRLLPSKHRFYWPGHADVVSQAARQTLCRTASNSLISSARDDKLPNS